MDRILIGVDGSPPSLKALDFGAELASKYNAELILLTVVPHLSPEHNAAVEEYARSERKGAMISDDGPSACRTVAIRRRPKPFT
jgi:nucleotide-binding universal stress UspA family protein